MSAEPVHDGGQVPADPEYVVVLQGDPGPAQDRLAVRVDEHVEGVERLERVSGVPGGPEGLLGPVGQLEHRLRVEELEEELLAVPVLLAVRPVHGPLAEQQVRERRRQRAFAPDEGLVVEPPDLGPAADHPRRPVEQSRLEDLGSA